MAGLRPFINGLLIMILFCLALFSFMFNYILVNNPSSEILQDPIVNSSIARFNSSISGFQSTANDAQTLLAQDEPSATTFLFLIFKSAFYIPLSFLSLVGTGISTFTGFIFTQIVGATSSPFYLAVAAFNSIMIIAVVFLIIQYIRTGQGER